MSELEGRAAAFAVRAHAKQKRKYSEEPYIVHPAEVAELVRSVPHTENMLAAAWLHDVVEDCGVSLETIAREFGIHVVSHVFYMSDISKPEDGNRARRKTIDREHIQRANPETKTIKLADIISNTATIVKHDPDFAKVYMLEKERLLEVLREGDSTLWMHAYSLVKDYKETLKCSV